MDETTLTVGDLLAGVEQAMASALPGPVWVRGEVLGLRRTSRGAAFFRLVDPVADDAALDVSARGRIVREVERALDEAGVGAMRDGIEVRVRGTVGLDRRRSAIRLSLLEVDPAFTAGRLAVDRAEVLRRLSADGSLAANGRLGLPLVPLRVGLVTSRGSAAHADFLDQLRISGFRFSVATAHATVQGEAAPGAISRALGRVGREPVDVVVLVRGGGSKLDLAAFDTEEVGRAVASAPVPVVTGIGHETDRSIADEAAAVALKTPTGAGEWLVSRVRDFSDRISTARGAIRDEARAGLARAGERLERAAAVLAQARGSLRRQGDALSHLGRGIVESAEDAIADHERLLGRLEEWFSTVSVDETLRRGFALVTAPDGRTVIRSALQVAPGDRLLLRLADGTVPVVVEKER